MFYLEKILNGPTFNGEFFALPFGLFFWNSTNFPDADHRLSNFKFCRVKMQKAEPKLTCRLPVFRFERTEKVSGT